MLCAKESCSLCSVLPRDGTIVSKLPRTDARGRAVDGEREVERAAEQSQNRLDIRVSVRLGEPVFDPLAVPP